MPKRTTLRAIRYGEFVIDGLLVDALVIVVALIVWWIA